MPRAISSVSSSASSSASSASASSSASSTSSAQQSPDGGSFSDALGRAQNKDGSSSPDAADSATGTTDKQAKGAKGSGKKVAAKNASPAPAAAPAPKAAPAKTQTPLTDDSDASEEEAPQDKDAAAKPVKVQKKDQSAESQASAATDTVQLAGNAAAVQPVTETKSSPDKSPRDGKRAQVQAVDASGADSAGDAAAGASTDADAAPADKTATAKAGKKAAAHASKDGEDDSTAQASGATVAATAPNAAGQDQWTADAGSSDSSPVSGAAPAAHAAVKHVEDFLSAATHDAAAMVPGQNAALHDAKDAAPPVQTTPEAQFIDANHPSIVSGIHGKLMPNGGTMQIRLDPPEMGAINIRVQMRDGIMTASFETSNDQAAKLLSHSLSDLKTALEAQGVGVEKLQVTQSASKQQPSTGDGQQGDSNSGQSAAQQEQQRKEMLKRMWRKLTNGQDPLDMVA